MDPIKKNAQKCIFLQTFLLVLAFFVQNPPNVHEQYFSGGGFLPENFADFFGVAFEHYFIFPPSFGMSNIFPGGGVSSGKFCMESSQTFSPSCLHEFAPFFRGHPKRNS